MLSPEVALTAALILTIFSMQSYVAGILSQRALVGIAGPALSIALVAGVMIQPTPPRPPLSAAEQAKQEATANSYLLGFATGMAVGR